MSREESAKLAEELLNRSSSSIEEKTPSDEGIWRGIKRNADNLMAAFDNAVTAEDRAILKEKIDLFRGYGPDMIKACSDRYKRDYLAEDIKVRKAHEMNEAAKLYMTNPSAGKLILTGLAQMFDTSVPQVSSTPETQAITEKKEEVAATVTLDDEGI